MNYFQKLLIKLSLLIICLYGSLNLSGQDSTYIPLQPSQLGFTGLIYTPSAYVTPWKTIDVGFTHFSQEISRTYEAGISNERAFITSIAFFPFMEVSLKLTRPYSNERKVPLRGRRFFGIGDRSVSARFRILKETKNRPALVFGIQDPFFSASAFFNTTYAVASKTLTRGQWNLTANAGWGYSDDQEFLHGAFGGLNVNWKMINLMVEYDTEGLNTGLSLNYKKLFFLQIASINGKGFAGNASVRLSFK